MAENGKLPGALSVLRFAEKTLRVRPERSGSDLRGKQVQRFFGGRWEKIARHRLPRIVHALVHRTLDDGMLVQLTGAAPQRRTELCRHLMRILVVHMAAWNEYVQRCAQRPAGHPRPASATSHLRIATLDLAIWYAYLLHRGGASAPAYESASFRFAPRDDRFLQNTLRSATVRIADASTACGVSEKMVHRWLYEGRRPGDAKLVHLAAMIETTTQDPAGSLLTRMRRHFVLRSVVEQLSRELGSDVVADALRAFYTVVDGTLAYLASRPVYDSLRPAIARFVVGNWFQDAPSGQLLQFLENRAESTRWRALFNALRRTNATPHEEYPMMIAYPRIPGMTDFDATTSDAFDPARRE